MIPCGTAEPEGRAVDDSAFPGVRVVSPMYMLTFPRMLDRVFNSRRVWASCILRTSGPFAAKSPVAAGRYREPCPRSSSSALSAFIPAA